ncbi:MAG: hypothetical protein JWM47_2490 [Acidimicrobiales bacterium]|nr:hypothetical protein [Acidimicrobiales bacterium]
MSPAKAGANERTLKDLMVTLKPVTDRAKKALQDPQVREQILVQGKAIAGAAQKWWAEHEAKADKSTQGPLAKAGRLLGGSFGQRKLERRLASLQASVETLRLSRSELGDSLAPVATTVEQLAVALELAGGLPVVKRKLAHRKIDEALDKLENSLFSAALPSSAK